MAATFMTDQNDFYLTANGQLQLETDDVIAAAIKLKHRFQLFLGEWFLDTRIGVPYFETVFVKSPNIELIRRMVRRIILSCPPIVTVHKVDIYYIPGDRLCAFEFEASAEDGRVVAGGTGQPYIVQTDGSELVVA